MQWCSMLPEQDRVRLQHMLDAANSALEFAEGRQRRDLEADRMLAFALVRALEVVGEAAAQVSEATREALPNVPWRSIVRMRIVWLTPTLRSTLTVCGIPLPTPCPSWPHI